MLANDDSSYVESHPLQGYPSEANAEIDDDASPLIVTPLGASRRRQEFGSNDSHLPSRMPHRRPSKNEPCAEQPTLSVLPAPTHPQSTLPQTRAKLLSKSTSLFLHGFVRCIITWVLVAGFYLSLRLYQDRVISPGAKSMFDAINVVLSIAFGLNIASGLKEIALDFRWWILGHRQRPWKEVEFILHCDSMTDLLKMMWTVPRPGTVTACITWLAINMLAQIGIASLGLTYSAVPGPEDIYLGSAISKISIPNLERLIPEDDRNTLNHFSEAFAAHVLGDIGSSYNYSVRPEQKLDGSPWASNPAAFWNATDYWEYVSLNSTPSNHSNGPGVLSVFTDRIIRSSGVCTTPAYQLKTLSIPATGSSAQNLTENTIMTAELTLLESGEKMLFPRDALNGEGTYYLSSPDNESMCGPGCGRVKVIETASGPPALGSFVDESGRVYFYDCNITVTSLPDSFAGSLPHDQASLAARAIGLSGAIPQLDGDWEYVFYNLGVVFGQAQNNSATGMASQLSRFAIGVIAAAAQTNQPKIVLGHVPTQGLRLTLDHPLAFGLILGLTGGIQLLLVVFTAITCGRLDIPKEIPLTHRKTLKKFVLPS
ncbi:hypothetical protein MMC29_000967 [Sticta canariensis]|nr:hypothetical protein [Sticta canariensis]